MHIGFTLKFSLGLIGFTGGPRFGPGTSPKEVVVIRYDCKHKNVWKLPNGRSSTLITEVET